MNEEYSMEYTEEDELYDRIEELEKQNKNLQAMLQTERELRTKEYYLKKIAKLEAENEELKEEIKAKKVVLNDFRSRVEVVTERLDKKFSQLDKAKEIIHNLLICLPANARMWYVNNEIEQAENFVKESL